jgi:hypothetical protein
MKLSAQIRQWCGDDYPPSQGTLEDLACQADALQPDCPDELTALAMQLYSALESIMIDDEDAGIIARAHAALANGLPFYKAHLPKSEPQAQELLDQDDGGATLNANKRYWTPMRIRAIVALIPLCLSLWLAWPAMLAIFHFHGDHHMGRLFCGIGLMLLGHLILGPRDK